MACKSAALHLALLAMLLRAVLPAGWMPTAITNANASPFVICTIDGPQHKTPSKPAHDHNRAGTPCVFAASIHTATPAAEPATVAPATIPSPIVFATHREPVTAFAQFRPNTARAPPSSI